METNKKTNAVKRTVSEWSKIFMFIICSDCKFNWIQGYDETLVDRQKYRNVYGQNWYKTIVHFNFENYFLGPIMILIRALV